jgi:hypothetical protein
VPLFSLAIIRNLTVIFGFPSPLYVCGCVTIFSYYLQAEHNSPFHIFIINIGTRFVSTWRSSSGKIQFPGNSRNIFLEIVFYLMMDALCARNMYEY